MNINELQEKREQIFNKANEAHGGQAFPYPTTLILIDGEGYSIVGIISPDFIDRLGIYYLDRTKTYHLCVVDDNRNAGEIIGVQQNSDMFEFLPAFEEKEKAREVADRIVERTAVNFGGLQ